MVSFQKSALLQSALLLGDFSTEYKKISKHFLKNPDEITAIIFFPWYKTLNLDGEGLLPAFSWHGQVQLISDDMLNTSPLPFFFLFLFFPYNMWKVQFVIGLPLALETSLRAQERDSISLFFDTFLFSIGFSLFALSLGKQVWYI